MTDFSALQSTSPDAGATERIRRRCHQALIEQRRGNDHTDGWLFAAAGLYLVAAIAQAMTFLN
jgi:hypothetical protein